MTILNGVKMKLFYSVLSVAGILLMTLQGINNPKNNNCMTTKDYSVISNTLKLPAKVSGEGNPLVLVPGGLTGWKSWEPFVDIFTSKQRKVIRVQLLNVEYGFENRQLPDDYSVKTESTALSSTLDSLGYTTPIDLVAWSYGAVVSLDFALGHPDRVRSLTLIEPPAIWILREKSAPDPETLHTISFFETLHGNITDDMLAGFLREAGFVKEGQSPQELPQWSQWLPFKQALRNTPALLNQRDKLSRLQNIKAPVLLVKGTGSATFLHKIIDNLSIYLPNSRVIEMPAGHAPHIVSRDRFLSELEKFQDKN
jgi:pimeloyl-ACP methyl ester carboxylesterase